MKSLVYISFIISSCFSLRHENYYEYDLPSNVKQAP